MTIFCLNDYFTSQITIPPCVPQIRQEENEFMSHSGTKCELYLFRPGRASSLFTSTVKRNSQMLSRGSLAFCLPTILLAAEKCLLTGFNKVLTMQRRNT